MKIRIAISCLLTSLVLALAPLQPARAEVSEVRLAQQFSMGYMQFAIMERNQLIEKHARAAGLGEIKVFWDRFNGPNFMNDALLAGKVDYVSGGVPGLITLWEKTLGTPQEVRGVSALSSQPFLLNSRSPHIKSIRDFTEKDRIAVPSIKTSVQAVTLQMAAARDFGIELIVMAARRPELRDYLIGPNATYVVQHATCSVLVLRQFEADP